VKRILIKALIVVLALFLVLNVVAYRHAWRMTHFVPAGRRTGSPGELSLVGKVKTPILGVEIPKPKVGVVGPEFPQPARTIGFVTSDGVKLEAWDIPVVSARGVAVMFHGYAGSRSGLLGESRMLHELGWRTVLVDSRGSGGSEGMATTLGWREAKDVAAAVNWAHGEWPEMQLLIYGQSMGAAAALRAIATENVRPDALVVECPFDKLLTTVGHRYHAMGLPSFPFAQLLVLWGGVQQGFDAFEHNPVEYARVVSCPVLVLDGEHDPWIRPDEARRVAAATRGPTLCHIFPRGGHGGYWWDVPDEYHSVVSKWMETISANRKSGSGR